MQKVFQLIQKARRRGDIHCISICTNAPIISHILFAYDCFLFFRADEREANVMKHILETYEAASGQAISLPKSKVYYSRSVPGHVQDFITSILGDCTLIGTIKYLGLTFMIGQSKDVTFGFIKDRIWHKIHFWSSKCLSKFISYTMSIYLLPNKLVDAIEKMINVFWWEN